MGRAGHHFQAQAGLEVTPRNGQGWRSPTSPEHSQASCNCSNLVSKSKVSGKVAVNSVLLSSMWEMRVIVAVDEEFEPALGGCQEHEQVTRVAAASQDTPALRAAGQMGWGQWEGNPGIPWAVFGISVPFTLLLCWRHLPAPSITAALNQCILLRCHSCLLSLSSENKESTQSLTSGRA